MFNCCLNNNEEKFYEELDFSFYTKNVKGECRDVCITYFPFHDTEEKKETPTKIKWDANVKVNITYSSNEYDRTMDKKQIAINLACFKKWFWGKYRNMKRSRRIK